MKRRRVSSKGSKRLFTATAGHNHIHPKNAIMSAPTRGGIRL